jgi:hypothetical protein
MITPPAAEKPVKTKNASFIPEMEDLCNILQNKIENTPAQKKAAAERRRTAAAKNKNLIGGSICITTIAPAGYKYF